jgi:hypothetical protein
MTTELRLALYEALRIARGIYTEQESFPALAVVENAEGKREIVGFDSRLMKAWMPADHHICRWTNNAAESSPATTASPESTYPGHIFSGFTGSPRIRRTAAAPRWSSASPGAGSACAADSRT